MVLLISTSAYLNFFTLLYVLAISFDAFSAAAIGSIASLQHVSFFFIFFVVFLLCCAIVAVLWIVYGNLLIIRPRSAI